MLEGFRDQMFSWTFFRVQVTRFFSSSSIIFETTCSRFAVVRASSTLSLYESTKINISYCYRVVFESAIQVLTINDFFNFK